MSYDKIYEKYVAGINIFEEFNPFRLQEAQEPFMGGLPIIFFTTPSMNVIGPPKELMAANPIFGYLRSSRYILQQLCYGNGGSNSSFIKILTNRFKGITLKDFNMRTVDSYETYYGWKQVLPSTNIDNYTAESSLVLNFAETKNLDITKIFYAWMAYIEAVRFGWHKPSLQTQQERRLDYTSSIYFFLLDFDMSTILYFCKYTGVYPTNVPLGSLVMSDIVSKGPFDAPITFAYQYKEELNPQIIYEFNEIAETPSKAFEASPVYTGGGI